MERFRLADDPIEVRAVADREDGGGIVKEQDDLTDAGVVGIQQPEGLAVQAGSPGESDEGRGIGARLDAGDSVDIQGHGHDGDLLK